MLESSQGPVPNVVELIAGEPVSGNWWSHPQSHRIFALTRSLRDSPDVLTCRAVNGKITFVHRRVWPALVRLAKLFPEDRLAAIQEVHTRTGAHRVVTRPFSQWVRGDVETAGRALSTDQAVSLLGRWAKASRVRPPSSSIRKRSAASSASRALTTSSSVRARALAVRRPRARAGFCGTDGNTSTSRRDGRSH